MSRSTAIWMIGAFWGIFETSYFGWNLTPSCVAELFADGGTLAFLALSIALRGKP